MLSKKSLRILLVMPLCVVTLAVQAYNVRGVIVETPSNEPLIQASVRLLAVRDSALVKGAVTDVDGRFDITDVKSGRYILESTYIGYTPQYRNLNITRSLRLDTIAMSATSLMLREVTAVGIKTPITVKEDTVEFNADSYKTAPNANVEALLKRLPGVEVDSDGKITANGKEITKILVDGKEFFSDDPTVASRNLPVEMVDKLQVVDRKSDLARLTGVDDGEEETVINLTVKKHMKQGWFGNVEGGYGTDDHYVGNFNINRFWGGNQITFLGAVNNINQLGFSDGTATRFRRFGGSNGITESQAFGINFNVGNEEIFRIGGNLLYSHSDRDTRQTRDRQKLFADSTSYENTGKVARDRGHNFRADFRVQWKPDSFNTLDFRPNISLNYNKSNSLDTALITAGDAARSSVTRSINTDKSDGNSFEFGGRLIYSHRFRKHRGRSFSVFVNYRMSNVHENSNTYSWNKFYLLNDSVDLYDQYATNHTWSNTVSSRVSWTEPLGDVKNGNFLNFSYNFQYRWNNADRLTYDHPVEFPDGWDGEPVISPELVFSERLSNSFRNDYMRQDVRMGYQHITAQNRLDVGLSLVPQMSQSHDLINPERDIDKRWVWNYAPYLRYRYRPSKMRSFSLDYNGRSSQPSMSQLQPVADVSDPLRIVVGNPNLDPSFTHNLRLRFHKYNPEAQQSLMLMLFGTVAQNSIISKTTNNKETGGRITTYENVNGVWNVSLMNMFSTPLRNRQFTINNHISIRYNNDIGFTNGQRNRSGTLNLRESIGFAWRPEKAELEIRPYYSYQNVTNTLQSSANRNVHRYGGRFDATYYTPFNLVLNTDLNYSATSGYSQGYDTKQWLWNATISYMFLRDQSLTLSLKAYDLLRQQSNISRSISASYITDTRTNSLGRYFMVTLAYKFNTFGKGGMPENRNGRRWGGPMGPPPGGRR